MVVVVFVVAMSVVLNRAGSSGVLVAGFVFSLGVDAIGHYWDGDAHRRRFRIEHSKNFLKD